MDNYTVYPKLLGKGSFGSVYLGLNKATGKLVAVKTEDKHKNKNATVLRHEQSILKMLNKGSVVFWEGPTTYYLVLPLHGPSLDSLHDIYNNRFSVHACMIIGLKFIDAIEVIHSAGIVHRDIKPANLLVDYNMPHLKLHIVDFGLSKKYRDRHGQHIPYKTGAMRVGSLRYMSKYTHQCVEACCRDDLYSFIYVLIYLYVGSLPWKGVIKDLTIDQRHANVLSVKQSFSNQRLASKLNCRRCSTDYCAFMTEITKLLDYLDTLKFGEALDYNRLKNYFHTIILSHPGDGKLPF
jgi:serine/threonine protein kinase